MSRKFFAPTLVMAWLAFSVMPSARATTATSHVAKTPVSVVTVVANHFKAWDKNGDGKLSREEIDAAISNPSVRGEAAAAVAALHIYFRDNAKAEPLTRSFLAKAVAAEKTPAERRDVAQKSPHFQVDFERFQKHIQLVPHDLEGKNAFRLGGVKQGSLGDCYFVSAVGALLYHHRSRVEQIFHPQQDGSCELRFANGNKVTVKKLTDAQIALSSSAGKQGLWLNLLEEGFGELRRQQAPTLVLPGDIAIDAISRGGNPRTSIALLTGHKAETFDLVKIAKDSAGTAKLREALTAGSKGRLLMTCSTPAEGPLPPGIANWHCYAVLGLDEATNKVHLWNPWGNNFKPKTLPEGMKHGYSTNRGRFDVPLADFVRIFASFDCESHEPAIKGNNGVQKS